jgi:hypothetical protein
MLISINVWHFLANPATKSLLKGTLPFEIIVDDVDDDNDNDNCGCGGCVYPSHEVFNAATFCEYIWQTTRYELSSPCLQSSVYSAM